MGGGKNSASRTLNQQNVNPKLITLSSAFSAPSEKQAGVYLLVSVRNVGSVSPLLSYTETVCASNRLQRSPQRKGLSASQLTLMSLRPKKFYHCYKVQILPGLSIGKQLALHLSFVSVH